MKILILPFLSLLLLVSLSESRTAKTKRNLADDDEFEIILEQAAFSESAEESDRRTTSEMTDGEVDLDTEYSYDENFEVRSDFGEEASQPIMKELNILWKRSGGQHAHPRYDGEGNAEAKNNVPDLEGQHSLRFDGGGLMEVTQYRLGGTRIYFCENRLEIYRTILVNVNETAILYSPSFLQGRKYPNNSNCGWRFETSGAHQLAFNCSMFDVREGDYLSLRDDDASELERFSGGRRLNHTTKKNSTFVVFYSNDKESGQGFNCSVTSVRESDSMDNRQVEDEPSSRSEIEPVSKQSPIAKRCENLSCKAELHAVDMRTFPTVEIISEEVPETGETPKDVESPTDSYDSVLNKSTVEKVDVGRSRANDDRQTYLKIETTSSSMHAGVYSSKLVQTVVDAMGNLSLATRILVNSTRLVGFTANVVEKREDGGGALLAGSYIYDPTRSNLPGHTTTTVLESNTSSETRENTEFVRDDQTGERHQENSSLTKKASSESTEIKSSRISFPDELVEPTPPM